MKPTVQMSLDLPIMMELKLQKPLYLIKEKVKCGHISQVALGQGTHQLIAAKQYANNYQITHKNGFTCLVELKYLNGAYECIGLAKSVINEAAPDDFRIEGTGATGQSLRTAQKGALYSLLAHWPTSKAAAMVVLPTGTGKTETMLATVLADKAIRTLVIVPTIDLKNQTTNKFATWGKLRELGVISGKTPNPTVCTLNKTLADIDELEKATVVVSTPALIARAHPDVKAKLKKVFSHVFFDEAHHIAAQEWKDLKALFAGVKMVLFTATPYRNDRAPVDGKMVYNYSLKQALADGVFSKISLISVDQRHPKHKDKAIADAAMARLLEDRKNGWTRHKMMVRTEKRSDAEN